MGGPELGRTMKVNHQIRHRHAHEGVHLVAQSENKLTGHLVGHAGEMLPEGLQFLLRLGVVFEAYGNQCPDPRRKSLADLLDRWLLQELGDVAVFVLITIGLPVVDRVDQYRVFSQFASTCLCLIGETDQ